MKNAAAQRLQLCGVRGPNPKVELLIPISSISCLPCRDSALAANVCIPVRLSWPDEAVLHMYVAALCSCRAMNVCA